MSVNSNDEQEKRIRDGLEALAADVPVPDVSKAFARHKRRREQRNSFRGVAAAALIGLLIVAATAGPAQAFKGFIKVTIARVLSETSQLFQRSDEGSIGPVDTMKIKQFESLPQLKQEQAASLLIPSGLSEESFIFAEALSESGRIKRLDIQFRYAEKLLRYLVVSAATSARFVDIEDFVVEQLTVDDLQVTAFSDDQGFTILEWDAGLYTLELSGDLSATELLEIGLALGVFN